MLHSIFIDLTLGVARAAHNVPWPPIVRLKHLTDQVLSFAFMTGGATDSVNGWAGGKVVVKASPGSDVLLLDTSLQVEGTGATTVYKAQWTAEQCDSAALRTFIGSCTSDLPCWCEIEWRDDTGLQRVAFEVTIAPSFNDPSDEAPNPAESEAWVWLKTRLAAGDNISFSIAEDTKTITIAAGNGIDGQDGREIELQAGATHIQWRYVGAVTWTDLIAKADIMGPAGSNGSSAYQLAVANGFVGDMTAWLASLKGSDGEDGSDGSSAYQLAVANGFVGDMTAWLASLKGSDGEDGSDGSSAYQLAVANGFVGDMTAWLASLKGSDGEDGSDGSSAYQLAVANGFVGDMTAWLASLKGADGEDGSDGSSAYQLAVANGFVGDMTAWLASLVGPTGATPALASQDEAVAGTNNTKAMTPLRTAQAIAALGGGGGDGGQLPNTAYVSNSSGEDGEDSGTAAKPFASIQAAYDSGARVFFVEGTVGPLVASASVHLIGESQSPAYLPNIVIKDEAEIVASGPRTVRVGTLSIDFDTPTERDASTDGMNGEPGWPGKTVSRIVLSGLAIGAFYADGGRGGKGGLGGSGISGAGVGGAGGSAGDPYDLYVENCIIEGDWYARGGIGGDGGNGGFNESTSSSADGGVGGAGGNNPRVTFRNSYIAGGGLVEFGAGGYGGAGMGDGSAGTFEPITLRHSEQLGAVSSTGPLLMASSMVNGTFYTADI